MSTSPHYLQTNRNTIRSCAGFAKILVQILAQVFCRLHLMNNQKIVLQSFGSNEIVNSNVFGSNVNFRVGSEIICTTVIGMHSDRSRETEIGKAVKEPPDMVGTARHSNKICFGSRFCNRGLFPRQPSDTTVIE